MKVALIMLICFLMLYAPLELSRLIWNYGLADGRAFELAFIWVLYLGAIVVLTKVVRV